MTSSYTLGTHLENAVRDLVRSGRYASASEVMRAGLRLLLQQEEERALKLEALRVAVRTGMDSGEGLTGEAIFAELEARYGNAADEP